MKIALLLGALGIASIFFTPKQRDITGTWVLDVKENKAEAAVLRMQMGEGYYIGKLDIPAQQLYDQPVAVQFRKDSITVVLDKQKNCYIKAAVTDSTMEGLSVVNGKSRPVKFNRK